MKNKIKNDFCILVHFRNPYIVSAGSEKYIQLQTNDFQQIGLDTIVIYPILKDIGCKIFGWGMTINKQFIDVFDEPQLIQFMQASLAEHSCQGVFVHHLMWCNLESLKRILAFSGHFVFYIHDYYACCGSQNLLEPDLSFQGKDAMLDFFANFPDSIAVAPSKVAEDIWKKSFLGKVSKSRIITHLNVSTEDGVPRTQLSAHEKINIAFVGNGIKTKGYDIWLDAVKSMSQTEREKYNFFHLGRADAEYGFINHIEVSIKDDGPRAMIEKLQGNNIHVAVLFSIWPETYSYTYYEALEAGCYIITSKNSGNICAQVEANQNGAEIEPDAHILKDFLVGDKLKVQLNQYLTSGKNQHVNVEYNKQYLQLLAPVEVKSDYGKNAVSLGNIRVLIARLLYKLRYRNVL